MNDNNTQQKFNNRDLQEMEGAMNEYIRYSILGMASQTCKFSAKILRKAADQADLAAAYCVEHQKKMKVGVSFRFGRYNLSIGKI